MKLICLSVFSIFTLFACLSSSSETSSKPDVPVEKSKYESRSQSEVVPILEMNIGGLLGGSQNGKWLKASEIAGKLKDGEHYKLFQLENIKSIDITGKNPQNSPECKDYYSIETDGGGAEINGLAFGSALNWNPILHPFTPLSLNSSAYKKIISDVLTSKGLTKFTPTIKQIYQVDLDNDNKNEIVLSATSFKRGLTSRADVGDYSFVLVRKIVNEKVDNFILEGDFVKAISNADAPAEHKISAIADLNGDGIMEIVIYSRYYEGDWVKVFELRNDKPSVVEELNSACGS